MQNNELAWEHVQFVIQQADEYGATAVRTWVLPIAAILLASEEQTERAVEHLALAFAYPLSPIGWVEKWPSLTGFQHKWQVKLRAERYQAVWEEGTKSDLEMMFSHGLLIQPRSVKLIGGVPELFSNASISTRQPLLDNFTASA